MTSLHETAMPPTHEFGRPSPELTRARQECPVFHDGFGLTNVTNYDDVVSVITDPAAFSSNVFALPPLPEEFRGRLPDDMLRCVLLNLDPPEHTAIRRTVTRAFTGRRMAAMEPQVREVVRKLVDDIAGRGSCELMSAFCYRLMTRIFPGMLGLTDDDMRRLSDLNEDLFSLLMQAGLFGPLEMTMSAEEIEQRYSPAAKKERYERMAAAWAHLGGVLDERRQNLGTDLTSAMLTTLDDEGRPAFGNDDMIMHMMSLLSAAAETTGNLVGTMVGLFDQHPDQLALLRADPRLVENAIDESLRTCPVPGVLMRRAQQDVVLSGVTIPAGSMVAASVDAAAHDDAHFPDADRFDITRANAKHHLTFGKGPHMCSGFPLGRLVARVAVTELYDRLPNLRVTAPIETAPVPNRRLLTRLEVAWG
jgi:cytochrome P450